MRWRIICSFLLLFSLLTSCGMQSGSNQDEAAIRKKSESFVDAFNRHDSKALALLWAEDAEYLDPGTGNILKGREEIEGSYRSTFAERGDSRIEIQIDEIAFPKMGQAIETGTAIVTRPNEEPNRTAYKAYYEKQNGEWLLTQVREVNFDFPPTQYEHLKGLEWLVGEWVDKDQDTEITTKYEWDKYKNFLTQHFNVKIEGQLILEGKQVIAWDPVNERIRSWVFDSDGGFGEGNWRKDGKSWVVESSQTLADGRRASAINLYTPVSQNSYTWESTGREVGGELLPDIKPVTVKRVEVK